MVARFSPKDGTSLRAALVLGALVLAMSGCASTKYVSLRTAPRNPLVDELKLTASGGPRATDRTQQLLRVYNLTEEASGDTRQLLTKLQAILDREPSPDKVYALAELAYLGAERLGDKHPEQSRDLYGAAVLQAYRYLFDPRFAQSRNPYDPQFRSACDLYNGALEAALRIECHNNDLKPGRTATIQTSSGPWDITCVLRGSAWLPQDIGHFDFVSNYEISGLKNQYQSYGLGVPLIAVREGYANEPVVARYYPPNLSFPVTAFLRPIGSVPLPDGTFRQKAVLELYDPLAARDIDNAGVIVPLESDLTTPLAYFLSDSRFGDLATEGLLHPEKLLPQPGRKTPVTGLYMVQPYEKGKIPVVMVHGLWSSPMTWMEMFNDLRSSPDIRANYQFWFYLYPTGQPFWLSAAQMRVDLAALRSVVDPEHREPALDQMVLIGHSMGGLVSRLQTLNSRDDFWQAASSESLAEVKANDDIKGRLQNCFYFQPNPSIRRVVTIGTPHRGSNFSNQTTQWLLGKLIRLPDMIVQNQQELFRQNPKAFGDRSLLRIRTSIDSLSPSAAVFPVMIAAQRAPWVHYNNIIGLVPDKGLFGHFAAGSDGVVAVESARMDDVESELVVPADHTTVHSHPLAVLEVRRILLKHLAELQAMAGVPPEQVARQIEVGPRSR